MSDRERAEIQQTYEKLRDRSPGPGSADFYDECGPADGLSLPDGLHRFLERYRRSEGAIGCVVRGFPLKDASAGPTPSHWSTVTNPPHLGQAELFIAACGLALGDPFTWATLQAGRMIQDILPIRGDERRQSGHGSESLLEFHTEDGFHPARCDYLLLFGVRNHDRVATILSSVRDVKLSEQHRKTLSSKRFHILPDDEHARHLRESCPDHPALSRIVQMQRDPSPVAVLFGDPAAPYLRIDRPFMRCVGDDRVAEEALDALMAELERVSWDLVVEQGSLLVLDNYLAVHGRRAFVSRYDGTDRWLKRMIVSRDLRKAADFRRSSRLLY